MPISIEKIYLKIKQLMDDYLNGSITIHFSEGNIMKVEIKEVTRNL